MSHTFSAPYDLDTLLSTVTITGSYIFAIFSALAAVMSLGETKSIIIFTQNILLIVQITLQGKYSEFTAAFELLLIYSGTHKTVEERKLINSSFVHSPILFCRLIFNNIKYTLHNRLIKCRLPFQQFSSFMDFKGRLMTQHDQ